MYEQKMDRLAVDGMMMRRQAVTPPEIGATTVYPAKAGAFPAVSFRTPAEASDHITQIHLAAPCGICSCPASSYFMHYPGTVREEKI